jgi:hypothetical protein
MAVKSRADILTDINTLLADNTTGLITAEVLRGLQETISDSMVNSVTDTGLVGLSSYSTTRVYYAGQVTQYDYKWYAANTTTVAGAFDPADWDFQGYIQYRGSATIETAQVLTLNSVPVLAIAPIASRIIRIVNVRMQIVYNSIPYATNTTVQIYTDTASLPQYIVTNMLLANVSKSIMGKANTVTPLAGETQLIENKGIYITVATGDPTAGDSTLIVYYDYIVVE